jgi:multiple sugar transport system ATP-binding protein
MGHRIAILDRGRLQQLDDPQEVYRKPANLFVARFIGAPPMNTIEGALTASGDDLVFRADGVAIPLPVASAGGAVSRRERVVVGVRPEHVHLTPTGVIEAKVAVVEALGHERHVVCRLGNGELLITRQPTEAPAPTDGETVRLSVDTDHLHVFDALTGLRADA